jgi:hypothetical protein
MIEAYEENGEVAFAASMRSTAKLYPNGQLTVETYSRTRAAFSGFRGRVYIICIDGNGIPHWISERFACVTRCSLFDVTCPSEGTQVFMQNFPEAVGRLSQSLDIIHFDEAKFRSAEEFAQKLIEGIKAAEQIAPEIKALLGALA